MDINKSVLINCKKEELWVWLTELDKLKKWNKTIVEEKCISTGEVGIGYKTKVLIKEGRKEIWYNNEILNYEPNRLLRIALYGGTLGKHAMTVKYVITENGENSQLSLNSKWKPSGILLRLFYPLIKIKATKNTEEVLAALKEQVEK